MKTALRFLFAPACMAAVAFLATGCSMIIPPKNMVPAVSESPRKLTETVRVKVTTGRGQSDSYYHFTGSGFGEALAEAIKQARIFSDVKLSGTADYFLEGTVGVQYQPFGMTLTHHIRSNWKLIRQSDQKEVWSDIIVTSHSATVGDAFAAVKRGRLATEGAAKKCIEEVVKSVGAAEF